MPTPGVSVSCCLVANHPEAHTSAVSSGDWALGAPCVSAAISWATLLLGSDRMLAEVKGPADHLGLFSEPQRTCHFCHILWFKASLEASHCSRVGEKTPPS